MTFEASQARPTTRGAVADNSAGHATLRGMIDRLRTLPADLVKQTAPEVRDALEADIAATAGAGVAPDGTPWQAKQDGGKPLAGVTNDVQVTVIGTVILATLRGKFVRHHKGTARGGIRRQVLPTRKIPDALSRAIAAALAKNFHRLTGG